MGLGNHTVGFATIAIVLIFSAITWAQMPPPGPPQGFGAAKPPKTGPEYAFRPDLTNPEYGQCLHLEKRWRSMWDQYNMLYQQAVMTRRSNPNAYAQMAWRLNQMRADLDAAWLEFSGKCVYFPNPRKP